MGQSQLTIVDAPSEGADSLLSFPPETGAQTGTPPRMRRWSRPRGFVEVGVSPLARAAVAVAVADSVGATRKRRTALYRRWAPRVGRVPYIVFVLGVAVGAFARGTTRSYSESAVAHPVVALPATPMSARDVHLESVSALGTTGSGPSVAVDAKAAVAKPARSLPESPRALPKSSGSRLAVTAVRPTRHLGTLRVNSTPSGADVLINGTFAGQTPLVLRAQPVGSRAVRVSREGYAVWSRGIRIVADEATTVSARLDRKQ